MCVALAAAVLAGCSGGSEGGTDVPWWEAAGQGADPPEDTSDAARFLHQATFGPTDDELFGLEYAGFDAWFDHQTSVSPSLHRPPLDALEAAGADVFQNQRQERWWTAAVLGRDQLRQRVAFALSEILVVSDRSGALGNHPQGLATYYDLLVRGAFGSYRELVEDVTKSPAMGVYLSHLRNQKGDPANNIRPDENYARELMQLFTIGLVELNADGTPRLDGGGHEIPTYTQTDIEELSRVLTGWTYAGSAQFRWGPGNFDGPMEAWPEYHDDGAKTILGGTVLPAGLTPEDDLDAALDAICAHPNVAPFVSTRLIQRLVTSNPSPAYVARIAAVFEDDGEGQRGQLGAVVRAILMDEEARRGHVDSPTTFGKLREPIVRMAGIWRAFDARAETGSFRYWNPQNDFAQAALRSPSVFNFFYPTYAPAGEVADAGLVAPEFQITTHTSITTAANEYRDRIFRAYPGFPNANQDTVTLQLMPEAAMAEDPGALLDHLEPLLMGAPMSAGMRSALVTHLENVPMEVNNYPDGMRRVADAIYLIVTSPEGSLQR